MHRLWLNAELQRFKPCGIHTHHRPVLLDVGGDAYWIRLLGNKRQGCHHNRLVLWEPNPHASELLRKKLPELEPHFSAVTLLTQAAANFSGRATLYYNAAAEGVSGAGSLREGEQAAKRYPDRPRVTVEATTVDKALQEHPPDFVPMMKIAVRGFEYHVLLGAMRTLQRTHTVWFECNTHLLVPFREVAAFLDRQGFLTYKVAHGGLIKVYGPYWDDVFDGHALDHNCLAIRKGSPLLAQVGIACNNR